MTDWEFVKSRTAAEGAVWRSADGEFYKRTGGPDVIREAEFQRLVFDQGYPVPEITEIGPEAGGLFFVERSLGHASLHDEALADVASDGQLSGHVVEAASDISGRLLDAQAKNPVPASPWFERAAFAAEVFEENPDLDNSFVRDAVGRALDRLQEVPMCHGHLDYGLPNAFRAGVIDWQHHGPTPLGYDVYPALDIVAFKGGGKGYYVSPDQRAAYVAKLDDVTETLIGQRLSAHVGDFLLVKCFFFLALMRPTDTARRDKHIKWQYRRALFMTGLEQYEASATVDTGAFPTFQQFANAYG